MRLFLLPLVLSAFIVPVAAYDLFGAQVDMSEVVIIAITVLSLLCTVLYAVWVCVRHCNDEKNNKIYIWNDSPMMSVSTAQSTPVISSGPSKAPKSLKTERVEPKKDSKRSSSERNSELNVEPTSKMKPENKNDDNESSSITI